MRTVVFKKLDRLIGPAAVWMLPRPSFRQPEHMGRILVIRPGGIGDAVLLLPLLTALKTVHRSARITVLAERRNGAVFSLSESVSDLLLYDRPYDLLKAVRDTYDAVIDTEQWHHLSAVIARMTGAPMLIGFATNDRARMFTHPVAYSQDDHEYASFMRLAAMHNWKCRLCRWRISILRWQTVCCRDPPSVSSSHCSRAAASRSDAGARHGFMMWHGISCLGDMASRSWGARRT
jgi:hypothetical protein